MRIGVKGVQLDLFSCYVFRVIFYVLVYGISISKYTEDKIERLFLS